MRTVEREIVSALIFSKDGKLFQGMKDPKDGGVYADCWHIPGGGIDDGEELIPALIREIKEETGLDISQSHIELIDDKGRGQSQKTLKDTGETVLCNMKFNVYKVQLDVDANEVPVSLNDDLVRFQWVDPKDLKDIKLTPPSVILFRRLGYL